MLYTCKVGVDWGDTAKYLNLFFYDRKLYLFDTFSGFDASDIEFEKKSGVMLSTMESVYTNRSTSMNDVMDRMFFPKQCIMKPGYFPESLSGLEDTFSLVHIDCDLQRPIMSALEYFYPRLSVGGFAIVHDYVNPNFPGVRQTVHDFSEQYNAPFVPDLMCGGAVFVK